MGFAQGLSGLNASAKQLDVIGNNIANTSTVGFKVSQAQFADVFASSLTGAGGLQIGIGTKVAAAVQQFTQGNITITNNSLDLAINGKGFFRLSDAGSVTYSRNGQFQMDKDGYIVNNSGLHVTGYLADAAGNIVPSNPTDLQISTADVPPNTTSASLAKMNLDSRVNPPTTASFSPSDPTSYNYSTSETVFDTLGNSHVFSLYFVKTATVPAGGGAEWVAHANVDNAPLTVASLATVLAQVQAVDTGGAAGLDTVNTAAGVAGNWSAGVPATVTTARTTLTSAIASADAADAALVAAGAAATRAQIDSAAAATTAASNAMAALNAAIVAVHVPASVANAALLALSAAAVPAAATAATTANVPAATLNQSLLDFNTSGQLTTTMPLTISVDLDSVASAFGLVNSSASPLNFTLDFTGTNQFGANFGVSTLSQDGYTSGRLSGFGLSNDGIVLGRYTNGQSNQLAQLVLANFANAQGLSPLGDNQWSETAASGQPVLGVPGSSSLGLLQSSAVEDSNVDLTAELVNMITAQRVYQANAQTIKTQDQVLQTLVNLR
jgi:flagellar hook protein FlgE